MRFLVRWAFRLLILLLVLTVALVLLKDVLLKQFLEHQLRLQTGMEARIERLEVELFSPSVNIENLKLFNTAEFGGSPLLDIPDLHVEYDPVALARRQLHLPLVRIALTELNVVEGSDGQTNVVFPLPGGLAPSSGARRHTASDSWAGFDFAGIDVLNLTLGRIKYSSLRRPGKSTEVKLGLKNEVLTRITSLSDLTNRVMKAMLRNGITIMTDSPPEPRRPKR